MLVNEIKQGDLIAYDLLSYGSGTETYFECVADFKEGKLDLPSIHIAYGALRTVRVLTPS